MSISLLNPEVEKDEIDEEEADKGVIRVKEDQEKDREVSSRDGVEKEGRAIECDVDTNHTGRGIVLKASK